VSVATKKPAAEQVFNVPNQLTALRLVLSIVLFALIPLGYYLTSLIVFLVAVSTDWIDGYYARRYGQVTTLGRILDPFVDKVIICGTFIYLGAIPGSGITAWMAVVIVARELLVTALRGFLEGEGSDFSAVWSGKLKMGFQCVAAAVSLWALTYVDSTRPDWVTWLLIASVWSAVALTIYSGVGYVLRAISLVRR
jgi:CDP-diacylglycerol---glycerol-3-phosphate 3-phosphatidyltransferase